MPHIVMQRGIGLTYASFLGEKMILLPSAFTRIEKKIVFVSKDYNIVFSVDINNGKRYLDCKFSHDSIYKDNICTCMYCGGGKVYFFPGKSNKCIIKGDKFERVIELDGIDSNVNNFKNVIPVNNNKLLLVGNESPMIGFFDISRNNFRTINFETNAFDNSDRRSCFWIDYVQRGETIYIPCAIDNKILKVDVVQENCSWVELDEISCGITAMLHDNNVFWLIPREGHEIICWDEKKITKRFPLPQEIGTKSYSIPSIEKNGDKIYFHDFISDYDVDYDINDGKYKVKKNPLYKSRSVDLDTHVKVYKSGKIIINYKSQEVETNCVFSEGELGIFLDANIDSPIDRLFFKFHLMGDRLISL